MHAAVLCQSPLVMGTSDEHPETDSERDSIREARLHDCLAKGDTVEALREAEAWTSWPLDDIGLWLLVEAYFRSQRPECIPILERMLRQRSERDELSVARMAEMIEVAKQWSAV